VVFLCDASVPMNRANPAGRKIKSVTSISWSAYFCELTRGMRHVCTSLRYRKRIYTRCSMTFVGWLIFHV